jgi:hypothetical protein
MLSLPGQSIVLWSRLHLLTNSRRVLRYTLYMIITNAILLHIPTSVLTFGSNSNSLTTTTLSHFVHGYNVMEKIQMVGFFLQECILSIIYIKETLRLLKLSEIVQDDLASVVDSDGTHVKHGAESRKIMYQLIAINTIIIGMDIALLAVEFANLYLIETTLKGVVYSIKLKLEFAVLGKLVQIVHAKSNSDRSQQSNSGLERHITSSGNDLERKETGATARNESAAEGEAVRASTRVSIGAGGRMNSWPDFVDRNRINGDVTHAMPTRSPGLAGEDGGLEVEKRRRYRSGTVTSRNGADGWIEEELVSLTLCVLCCFADGVGRTNTILAESRLHPCLLKKTTTASRDELVIEP